jgi:hypothetical protein
VCSELVLIGDLLVNHQVFGLNSNRLIIFIYLDDAGQWLSIDVLVIVENHVQPIVDGTHSLGVQGNPGLIRIEPVLYVLSRRNGLLLLESLAFFFNNRF